MKPGSSLLAALMLVVPLAARAAPPPPHEGMGPPCPDPEISRLRTEIGALKLDRLLNLSREQARSLLPALKEAQQLATQTRAEMDKRKPAIVKALTAARDEVQRTGQVSEGTAQALRDARGDAGMRQLRGKMKALRDQVKGQLTVEQFERLRGFDPSPIDRGAKGRHGGDDDFFGGEPPRGPGGKKHAGGPGAGHQRMMVLHIALSPEFTALVEQRAK